MSVLIISPEFFQEHSARAIQVRKLYKGLFEKSLDFYLATVTENKNHLPENVIPLKKEKFWLDKFRGGPVTKNGAFLNDFIKKKKIKTILTISSPLYAALVGLYLKKQNPSLQWISYFSDPVPVFANPAPYSLENPTLPMRVQHRFQLYVVRKVLKQTDRIITPAKNTLEYMERLYSLSLSDRAEIIPHMGSFINEPENPSNGKNFGNYLVYFGDLYKRSSRELIEAVRMSAEKNPELFKGLICYGTNHTEFFSKSIKELGTEEYFKIYPAVDYEDSLRLMRQAPVLLLIEADMSESPFMPSKYFDYLFSNRPILAISPPKNSLEDYYRQDDGFVIVEHERNKIASAIEKLFSQSRKVINRDLIHLNSDAIINNYMNLLKS